MITVTVEMLYDLMLTMLTFIIKK
jgi:hypothetical protein